MARINLWETVVNGSGLPITGASVDVYLARTTTDATIFAAESGGGTLANPVTTTNGLIPGWVEEGEYDLHVTGVGITETTKRINLVLGGNPAKAADSITAAEIGPDQVGTSEIAPGAVTSAELAADAVIAGKIAAGAISQAADFAPDVVDAAAIAAGAVGSGELGAGAVTAGKIAAGGISAASQFGAGVVDAAAIGVDAVGNSELANDAVQNANIADGTIHPLKLDFAQTLNCIGQIQGSGDTAVLSATYEDIPGLSINVNMTSQPNNAYILLFGSIDAHIASQSSGSVADETLQVEYWLTGLGGAGASGQARCRLGGGAITWTQRTSIAVNAGFNLTIGTNWTIKMRARVLVGDPDTDSIVHGATSSLMYVVLGTQP